MKILITGYRGFIGRHFYEHFMAENDAKPGTHQIAVCDIKDHPIMGDCRQLFGNRTNPYYNEKFDLVIHCAAIVGGRMTIEGNPIAVATDLSVDAEMFNWAVETNQPRIIYFSSSAAYPIALQAGALRALKESDINLDNDFIGKADMTYGWTKLTGEYLAQFARQRGVKVHIFRPFSGYGEDQDLDYPFPSFIKRAVDRENPFVIWGDGLQVRDFIHVDDIIAAVMKAVELDIEGPVNLCTGRPTSFQELSRIVLSQVPYTPMIEYLHEKPVGVRYRLGDPTFMETFYKPVITLEEGVQKAIQKYEEAKNSSLS